MNRNRKNRLELECEVERLTILLQRANERNNLLFEANTMLKRHDEQIQNPVMRRNELRSIA